MELPSRDSQFPAEPTRTPTTVSPPPTWCSTSPRCRGRHWQAEVTKMVNTYKAPIDNPDIAPIAYYLTQTKGTN